MHLEIATPEWINIPNDEFFELQVLMVLLLWLLLIILRLYHNCLLFILHAIYKTWKFTSEDHFRVKC